MTLKSQFESLKEKLINDKSICKENRQLFKEFYDLEEYKLKRTNNLPKIDDNSYRTLLSYISKLRNVNSWFKNKIWKNLTKEDIKKVYDDLEDNKLLTIKGTPFKDKEGYYTRVFKSKPFELAGKADIAREVMEY